MKLKQLIWTLSPFAAGALLWLTLGAAADLENVYFPSVRVAHTNYVNELVVTNGATINGVRQTSWPSGGSAPVGTLITNGAAISAGDLAAYGTGITNMAKATSANVQAAIGSVFQPTNSILQMISTNSTPKQAATNMLGATGSSADALLGNGNWGVIAFANTTNSLAAPGDTNQFLNGKGLWAVPPGGSSLIWQTNIDGTVSLIDTNLVLSLAGTLSADVVQASSLTMTNLTKPRLLMVDGSGYVTNTITGLLSGSGSPATLEEVQAVVGNTWQSHNSTLDALATNITVGTGRIALESMIGSSGSSDPLIAFGTSTNAIPIIVWTKTADTNLTTFINATVMGAGPTNSGVFQLQSAFRTTNNVLIPIGTNNVSVFQTDTNITAYFTTNAVTNIVCTVQGLTNVIYNWAINGTIKYVTNGSAIIYSAPVVSNVNTNSPGNTNATITADSDIGADCGLALSTVSGSYTNTQWTEVTPGGVSHQFSLSNLIAATPYYFKITSTNTFDSSKTNITSEYGFTTAAAGNSNTNDVYGYWTLDTTSWLDSSGNGHSGTTHGIAGVTNSTKIGAGAFQAYASGSSYVSFADNDGLSALDNSLTIAGWVMLATTNALHTVLGKYGGVNGQEEYNLIWSQTDNGFRWSVYTNGASGESRASLAGPISTNAWYYLVAQIDTTNKVNRIRMGDSAGNLGSWNTTSAWNGYGPAGHGTNTTAYFAIGWTSTTSDARVDELIVLDRLWTDSEITNVFNAGNGKTWPLTP